MLGRGFPTMFGMDPFGDFFHEDPFSDPFFSGRGGRMRGMNLLEHGDMGGMSMMPASGRMGGLSMMSMGGGMGSGSVVMMSSSFSSNGREVHSSSTTARMGPGGVAEVQRQVRDGRSGQEKIILERRLGDKARRVEKSRNLHTGDEETVDNTFGIEVDSISEDDMNVVDLMSTPDGMEEHFDNEWQQAARSRLGQAPAVSFGSRSQGGLLPSANRAEHARYAGDGRYQVQPPPPPAQISRQPLTTVALSAVLLTKAGKGGSLKDHVGRVAAYGHDGTARQGGGHYDNSARYGGGGGGGGYDARGGYDPSSRHGGRGWA